MKVYIDFDDVLCESAEYFTKIAKEMFGIEVPYRQQEGTCSSSGRFNFSICRNRLI